MSLTPGGSSRHVQEHTELVSGLSFLSNVWIYQNKSCFTSNRSINNKLTTHKSLNTVALHLNWRLSSQYEASILNKFQTKSCELRTHSELISKHVNRKVSRNLMKDDKYISNRSKWVHAKRYSRSHIQQVWLEGIAQKMRLTSNKQ